MIAAGAIAKWAVGKPGVVSSGGSSTSLTIQDALHGHTADGVVLTTQWLLAIAESLHGHAADNLTLSATGAANLVVQDAAHAHIADSISLTTNWLLSIADALHSHAADNLSLDASNATFLTIQDALHSHAADSLGFSLDTWLTIVDAAHAHTADAPTLSVGQYSLQIAESMHAFYSDTVYLSITGDFVRAPDGFGPRIITPTTMRRLAEYFSVRPFNQGGTRY